MADGQCKEDLVGNIAFGEDDLLSVVYGNCGATTGFYTVLMKRPKHSNDVFGRIDGERVCVFKENINMDLIRAVDSGKLESSDISFCKNLQELMAKHMSQE